MKKSQALNYLISQPLSEYKAVEGVEENNSKQKIVQALTYVENRGIEIKFRKKIPGTIPLFQVLRDEENPAKTLPEFIVIYTNVDISVTIEQVNDALHLIDKLDKNWGMVDNPEVVEIENIMSRKYLECSTPNAIHFLQTSDMTMHFIVGFDPFEEVDKRGPVYDAIDTERDYQDIMTNNPTVTDMIENFRIGDALSAMQVNLAKAHAVWYADSAPYQNTMTYLRKIAAICVNMGEQYGMPEREIPLQA